MKRFLNSSDLPFRKDAEGNPLCRWCGGPVKRPRRSWCSDECVDQYKIRSGADSLRAAVKKRDNGICAACGCDTEKLDRIFWHARRAFYELVEGIGSTEGWWRHGDRYVTRYVDELLRRIGFDRNCSLWHADHVIEVVNGGETSLRNVQTLCVPCHKQKTRRFHAERARLRRDKKRALLG